MMPSFFFNFDEDDDAPSRSTTAWFLRITYEGLRFQNACIRWYIEARGKRGENEA